MSEYLSPGVYVEEYDSAPRSIEGVGTSTAGFVGMAVKGLSIGAPSLVSNFADFGRQFGGFLTEYTHGDFRYLAYAVEQFFGNGGTRCYVSRVVPENAAIATARVGGLSLRAANEGKWGNRLIVTAASSNKRKLQLIKKEAANIYIAKSSVGFREGDLVEFAGEVNRILSIFESTITFEQEFEVEPVDTALVPKLLLFSVEMDIVVRYDSEIETFNGLTLNPTSPNYIAKKLAGSQLIVATIEPCDDLINPVSAIFGDGQVTGSISFSGGSDGTMDQANAGIYIGQDGGPGRRTGIQSFIENNVVSIIAVPGITIPEVMVSLIAHCENIKSRFAVLDMPFAMMKTGDLKQYRDMVDSTYAAMYHPWIQVFDRAAKKSGFVPPSGAVCGVYSRTDVTRGVHKAPANETINCSGLSINYTSGEQDILNPAGINLIRAIPGQGIRIWGARTTSGNSSFKYVNVRRLFIFVEESIKAATNWVVFEPNNSSLWARVQVTVSAFLENLFRAGMLSGDTPGEAFFVEIGPTTMSQDDILSGRLICNIGIAPSRPAEFVIFRITQFTSEAGASAE